MPWVRGQDRDGCWWLVRRWIRVAMVAATAHPSMLGGALGAGRRKAAKGATAE